jgi:hypothetical protein
MLDRIGDLKCCGSCAGSGMAELTARRRSLRAAVLAPPGLAGRATVDRRGQAVRPPAHAAVVTGTVVDASPHVLAIVRAGREERFALRPGTRVWKGGQADPTALVTGDHATVRLDPSRRGVADQVWACIGRVTGTILERDREGIVVDAGKARPREALVIPGHAESRIQVRFPRLEPGYLIDVIGVRRGGAVEGLIPATSQPAYRADQVPPPPQMAGHPPARIGGSATWHEPAYGPDDAEGVAYPMLDPGTGCIEAPANGPCCVRLPYLSIGSMLEVRNECTGGSRVLPVTGCGAVARLFCDRCVTCGTSPRGRVADLTLASFVSLGGEPERGCFNATVVAGQ